MDVLSSRGSAKSSGDEPNPKVMIFRFLGGVAKPTHLISIFVYLKKVYIVLKYVSISIYIYIYLPKSIHIPANKSKSLSIYIYICVCVCLSFMYVSVQKIFKVNFPYLVISVFKQIQVNILVVGSSGHRRR